MSYGVARRSHGESVFVRAVAHEEVPVFTARQVQFLRECLVSDMNTASACERAGDVPDIGVVVAGPKRLEPVRPQVVKQPRSGEPSRLRQLFQETGRWRSVKSSNDQWEFKCAIHGCGCLTGWERKRESGRRMAHLYQCHGIERPVWKEIQADEAKIQDLIVKGSGLQLAKRRKRHLNNDEPKVLESKDTAPKRKIVVAITQRSPLQRKLTELWVRNVVVRDGNLGLEMRSGLRSFLQRYSELCGASLCWAGPARESARMVAKRDLELCTQRMRDVRRQLPLLEGATHTDEWTDTENKVTYLGAMFSYLDVESGMPKSIGFAFTPTKMYEDCPTRSWIRYKGWSLHFWHACPSSHTQSFGKKERITIIIAITIIITSTTLKVGHCREARPASVRDFG